MVRLTRQICTRTVFFFKMAPTKQQVFVLWNMRKRRLLSQFNAYFGDSVGLIHLIRTLLSVGICNSWRKVACAKAKATVASHVRRRKWREFGELSSTARWSRFERRVATWKCPTLRYGMCFISVWNFAIIGAFAAVTGDMLIWVWQEMNYHIMGPRIHFFEKGIFFFFRTPCIKQRRNCRKFSLNGIKIIFLLLVNEEIKKYKH